MNTPMDDLDTDLVTRIKAATLAVRDLDATIADLDARRRACAAERREREKERNRLLTELAAPAPMPLFQATPAAGAPEPDHTSEPTEATAPDPIPHGATSSLLTSPDIIDPADADHVLYAAVGGRDRRFHADWTALVATGADDAAIEALIHRIWEGPDGTGGAEPASSFVTLTPNSGMSYTRQAGDYPAIWIPKHVEIDGPTPPPEPTYAGDDLLHHVRRVLSIPRAEPAAIPTPAETTPEPPVPLYDEAADGFALPSDPLDITLRLALNLIPEPVMKQARERGATDRTIKGQLLAGYWGTGPSHATPVAAAMGGYWTRGGLRPAFWAAASDAQPTKKGGHKRAAAEFRKPDLEGKALIQRVREVARIPLPSPRTASNY